MCRPAGQGVGGVLAREARRCASLEVLCVVVLLRCRCVAPLSTVLAGRSGEWVEAVLLFETVRVVVFLWCRRCTPLEALARDIAKA